MSQAWRPISEAPANGEFIILAGHSEWHTHPLYVTLGCYSHSRGGWTDERFKLLSEKGLAKPLFWIPIPVHGQVVPNAREQELERQLKLAQQTIGQLQDTIDSMQG